MTIRRKIKIAIAVTIISAIGIFAISRAAHAQVQNQYWKMLSNVLQPVLNTWSVKVPSLAASPTACVTVDSTGLFGTMTCATSGGGISTTTAGIANRVTYWSGASSIAADDQLGWDPTNNRLSIGDVAGLGGNVGALRVNDENGAIFTIPGDPYSIGLTFNGNLSDAYHMIFRGDDSIDSNQNGDIQYREVDDTILGETDVIHDVQSGGPSFPQDLYNSAHYQIRSGGNIDFFTGGTYGVNAYSIGNLNATIDKNGNFGIGSSTPSTKLVVAGTATVQNFIATSTATSTAQNLAISDHLSAADVLGTFSMLPTTIADSSSNARNGTAVKGTAVSAGAQGIPAKILNGVYMPGGAYDDSSETYISIPNAAYNNFSTLALHGFFCFDNVTSNTIIAKQHDGSNSMGILSLGYSVSSGGGLTAGTAGKIYFHPTNGGPTFISNGTVAASANCRLPGGTYYDIDFNASSTGAMLHINGAFDTYSAGNYSLPNDGSPTSISIGAWIQGGPSDIASAGEFKGVIDDFAIFNTSTLSSISTWYNSGTGAAVANNASGLQALYHFNDTPIDYAPVYINKAVITHLSGSASVPDPLTLNQLNAANINDAGSDLTIHSDNGTLHLDSNSSVYIQGNTGSLTEVGGDLQVDGKVYSSGGVDPPYMLYDAHTREYVRGEVLAEVPVKKQNGAAQFWDQDTHRLEIYIASEDAFYDLLGNKLPAPVTSKSEAIKSYKLKK